MLNNESVNQLENQINEFYEQLVWPTTKNLIDRSVPTEHPVAQW
jgi:hypothetical protein